MPPFGWNFPVAPKRVLPGGWIWTCTETSPSLLHGCRVTQLTQHTATLRQRGVRRSTSETGENSSLLHRVSVEDARLVGCFVTGLLNSFQFFLNYVSA